MAGNIVDGSKNLKSFNNDILKQLFIFDNDDDCLSFKPQENELSVF